MKISPFVRFGSAFAISTAVVAGATQAHAQTDVRGDLGARRTLVIDELSGFRASTVGGVSYAGPIGVSFQSLSTDVPTVNGVANAGSTTDHYTNVWFAPSADFFVINHLSVGGLLEVTHTSHSQTVNTFNTSTTTTEPSNTNFTFLPRVGWMFAITDRFGIWPRLGLGYAARTQQDGANANIKDTFSAFVMDLDVGFVYRINQTFFLSGRPELTLAPGSHSLTDGNVTTSVGGSFFQFALTGGVGIMWDL